jgi:predicted glycoside hydrolase/deacetylase ChbG (UPF0249 family)
METCETGSADDFGLNPGVQRGIVRTLSSLRPDVTEVMVHPGYRDGEVEGWPSSRHYRGKMN